MKIKVTRAQPPCWKVSDTASHVNCPFIAFFKLETSNKNYIIQNESVYVCTKYHSNKYLFTQLSLHSFTVILIFTICNCFYFEICYRIKAVVCQNILKTTVHCPAVIPL
jgi:hypothetical protein